MKILFFSYAYPNACNPGLATFNRTMIAGLANENEVRVVSPVPFTDVWKWWAKGKLPRGLNDPNFQAVANVTAEYCTWYYTPKVLRRHYGQFMHRSVQATLNRVMKEFQPDVVLSYWTHPDSDVAVKTAHEFGIRAVAMVGGSDVLLNARSGSRRKVTLKVLQDADGVVTVSDDIKQVLIGDGVPAEKIHTVRRGINRDLFHPGDIGAARKKLGLPDDRPILVSVGRLDGVKGHAHLIQACQLLKQRQIPFRCYFLGDGPLKATLSRQVEEAGLTNSIELKGSQTPAQLADWYRAADLSILASLSEGVPNVLLESIACGTPFVASNVGGIPEIADPTCDALVPASDPSALADAIAEKLLAGRMPTACSRRFEPLGMKESAAKLSLILQSVRTGQPVRTTSDIVLHETMTEADVDDENTVTKKKDSTMNETKVDSLPYQYSPDDICGRTGEFFLSDVMNDTVFDAASVAKLSEMDSTAACDSIESLRNRDVRQFSQCVNTESDRCDRTGEGFEYIP